MLEFRKKAVAIVIGLVLIALLVGGYLAFSPILYRVWDDETTWSIEQNFSVNGSTKNVKYDEKQSDNGKSVSIPVCLLYKIDDQSSEKITYSCSAFAPYSTDLLKYFHDSVKLTPDFVFTYTKGTDPLPGDFLGRIGINEGTITSFGSDPVPVSMEFVFQSSKPSRNLISMFDHWLTVRRVGKQAVQSSSVKEWKISLIPGPETYSPSDQEALIRQWRVLAWKEFNDIQQTYSHFTITDSQKFLNSIAPQMQFHNYFCPPMAASRDCVRGYERNASTNFIFYAYTSSVFDKSRFAQLVNAFRTRLLPFVFETDPARAKAIEDCDEGDCLNDYSILEQYDYPACPMLELGKKTLGVNGKLFLEYRKLRSEVMLAQPRYVTNLDNTAFVSNLYRLATEDFKASGADRKFSPKIVYGMDDVCYKILRDGIQDPIMVNGWKETVLDMLWGQLFIDERGTRSEDATLFEIVYRTMKLNPYKTTFLPSPQLTYQRLYSGVQKEDNSHEPSGQWNSIGETAVLLYLTSTFD